MKFIKNNLSFTITLLIIISINLYLVSLPLTNLVGYEFSAVNGVLLAFIGGLYSLNIVCESKGFFNSLRENKSKISLLVLLPLIIGFTNHLFFEICPVTIDLFFYLIITIPALFISVFIAYWVSGLTKRLKWLIFLIVFFHFVAVPIIEIYFNPQVYFYNPIILFFPGNIYDEDISITGQMILYRILTLIVYLSFVYFTYLSNKIKPKYLIKMIPVVILVLFFFLKSSLSFTTNNVHMEKVLSAAYGSNNFRYFFSPKVPSDLRKIIMLQHEFHYNDIREKYKADTKAKITSYIFKNGDEKRKYFGAGNADVAKPWLHSVYVNADNYFSSLRHEIAHVFSAEFGVTPFKVASWFNPALIEGYAMALENNFNDNTNHYLAWLARESGYSIPLKNLFTGQNFFKNASSLSYIVSGSFVQFLMEKYDPFLFNRIYAGETFVNVYHKSIDDLEVEYFQFLDNKDYLLNESIAKTYFARKALIQKVCPRYTANRLKEAAELYLGKKYARAARVYKEIFDYSNSYEAIVGYTRSLNMLYEVGKSIKILYENIPIYENTSYYNNLLLRLGDYNVLIDDYESADKYYRKLETEFPIIVYDNAVKLRSKLLKENKSGLKEYVEGTDEQRLEITLGLLSENFDYKFLPITIELSSRLKRDYKLFIGNFVDIVKPESYEAFYATLEVGKYAIENGDFASAAKIFNKKLSYTSNTDNEIILEQYRSLADWLETNNTKIEIIEK